MLLFDWSKIYKESNGNTVEIVRIAKMLTYRSVPKDYYDPIFRYSQKSFSGDSFLLHPKALFEQSHKYTFKEVGDYIASASFRSYANYLVTKKPTLNRVLLPIPMQRIDSFIENNRLLSIEGDEIHFLYEEVN